MSQTSDTRKREPARNGDEQDAITAWRKVYAWTQRAGARRYVKRSIRRRERRAGKNDA